MLIGGLEALYIGMTAGFVAEPWSVCWAWPTCLCPAAWRAWRCHVGACGSTSVLV
jgi:hypothetical protein